MADEFDPLIARMLAGNYVPAREFRKAIDQAPEIRQRISLAAKYSDQLEAFFKSAEGAAAKGEETFTHEGSPGTFNTERAKKVQASTEGRKGGANFRQINQTLKRMVPALMKGNQLGHANISVLRTSIAKLMDAMPNDDERREPLATLYASVKIIDDITDQGEATLDKVLATLEAAAETGFSVKGDFKKDVNVLKAIEGDILLTAENRDLNQLKGRLAARMGIVFKKVVEGNLDYFRDFFDTVDVANIKGSPTLREDVTEGLVEVIDPKIKRTKNRRSATSSKTHTGGGKAGKLNRPKRKKIRKPVLESRREKSPPSAPLMLIGILNQQLPQKVRKNMVEPRLVNRTGRFADSVKVTDVSTTAQGFPSIGYTYQREIYETFEVGNRQGSANRDPRRLIDISMREIAAQFAIGRFYTRRV